MDNLQCSRQLLTDDAELCVLLLTARFPGGSAVTATACLTTTPPCLAIKVASTPAAAAADPAGANDRTAVVLALPNNPNMTLLVGENMGTGCREHERHVDP